MISSTNTRTETSSIEEVQIRIVEIRGMPRAVVVLAATKPITRRIMMMGHSKSNGIMATIGSRSRFSRVSVAALMTVMSGLINDDIKILSDLQALQIITMNHRGKKGGIMMISIRHRVPNSVRMSANINRNETEMIRHEVLAVIHHIIIEIRIQEVTHSTEQVR